jgi:chromosome partitioning protein
LSRVFAITNQKGGVGKTTTAINLAAALAANDFRVLVIDSDPQGNATTGLGVTKDTSRPSLYDVLLADAVAKDAIVATEFEGLHLISADKNLLVPIWSWWICRIANSGCEKGWRRFAKTTAMF